MVTHKHRRQGLRVPFRALAGAIAAFAVVLTLATPVAAADAGVFASDPMSVDSGTAGATLSGTVTTDAPGGFQSGWVSVSRVGYSYDTAFSSDGKWQFTGIAAGEYRVHVGARPYPELAFRGGFVDEHWPGTPYLSQAMTFTVSDGEVITGLDLQLSLGSSISGRVTDPQGNPLGGIWISAQLMPSLFTGTLDDDDWAGASTDSEGRYTMAGLSPGYWAISAGNSTMLYRDEFFNDKANRWDADPVLVTGAQHVVVRDIALSSSDPDRSWGEVSRLAGESRFETATLLSSSEYGAHVPVVYIANGRKFPDALAAAPLAVDTGGPLLLSESGSLPAVVRTELDRLLPSTIVVLGSEDSISAAVAAELTTWAPVTRLAGSDRYATSVAISQKGWGQGVPEVYVTSGVKFPDALAVAAVASQAHAPILLTTPDTLPAAVKSELARLKPEQIMVLGGVDTVSAAAANQVDRYSLQNSHLRLAGRDRYATAALLTSWHQPGVSTVYLASGTDFPDALAAAPVVGSGSGVILLTARDTLPPEVRDEILRLQPDRIVILGGYDRIGTVVQEELEGLR